MTTDGTLESPTADVAAPVRQNLILTVACLCQLMVILDISVVNVALPGIDADLHFPGGTLSWVVNAYTLAFGGLLLLGGRLADLAGHRRTMLGALVIFGVASVLGGLAQNPGELVAARAVQGISAAALAPVTLTVIMVNFPEGPQRRRAIMTWGMVAAGGSALGVLLSGILTEYLNWRWVLFVNIPFVVAALALALVALPDTRPAQKVRLDVPGAILVTASMTLLAYGTVYAGEHSWGSTIAVTSLAVAVVAGLAFAWWELRVATAPLVRFSILRNRTVWVADVIIVFIGAATVAGFYFASLFLQNILHYSPIRAGAAFLPFCIGIVAGTLVSGKLAARFGQRATLTAGLAIGGVGMLGFGLLTVHSSFWVFLFPSIVGSFGIGSCMITNTTMGTSGVAPTEAGLVSGLLNTSRQVGGSIALAVLATVASTATNGGDLRALAHGYRWAFVLTAVFVLVAALVAALFVPSRLPGAPERA